MLVLDDSDKLILEDRYVLYKLDIDEGLYWLFDVEEGSYFDLNNVSFFIFSQFDGAQTLGRVRDVTIIEFQDTDRDMVAKDFNELIQDAVTNGILSKGGSNDV